MAQTAIAPANLRPLAPAPSASKSSSSSSTTLSASPSSSSSASRLLRGGGKAADNARSAQRSISIRPLKPLAAAPNTTTTGASQPRRPIAIAPNSSTAAAAARSASPSHSLRASPIHRSIALPTNTAHSAASSAEGSSSTATASSSNHKGDHREDSVGSSSTTSSSTSNSREASEVPGEQETHNSNSTLMMMMLKGEAGGTVQPSKEWILPARAKPGRKPSEVEPPTKRKAQNRASQRAFRERKQSYVASLEQKIEEYEKRGAELSSELQKVARRLKEENDQLVKENAQLKDRIYLLEQQQQQEQAQTHEQKGRNKMLTSPPAKRGAGGRSSSHHQTQPHHHHHHHQSSHAQSRAAMGNAEALITNRPGVIGGAGSNLWPWGSAALGTSEKGSEEEVVAAASKGLEMDRDCGFCTEDSLCVCRGEAVLDLTEGNEESEDDNGEDDDDDDDIDEKGVEEADGSHHSPMKIKQEDHYGARNRAYGDRFSSLRPSSSQTVPLDLPLNKTTKKLWYTVPGPSNSSSSSSMSISGGSARNVRVCPTESRYRLPFRLGSNSNVLPPLQITAQGKPKLWPVYSSVPQSPCLSRSGKEPSDALSSHPHQEQQQQINTVPIYRLRKPVALAPGESAPACSGDPAHCGACSTDPALAAFCRAVASHLNTDGDRGTSSPTSPASNNATPVTPAILDAGNALPLRNLRKRSYSSTVSYTNAAYQAATAAAAGARKPTLRHSLTTVSPSSPRYALSSSSSSSFANPLSTDRRLQSIPEAWRMIKRHPQFSNWKGGLDMLADVVSKKAHSEDLMGTAPSDLHQGTQDTEGEGKEKGKRVEITRRPSISMKFHRKSSDRLSRETLPKPEEIALIDAQAAKRRKLYVEREGVEDALALLDRNGKSTTGGGGADRKETPSTASASVSPPCSISGSEAKEACVCPLSRLM